MNYNKRIAILFFAFCLTWGCSQNQKNLDMELFSSLNSGGWKEVFSDSCTKDWHENWFIDGQKAKVENTNEGMNFTAGPSFGNDSSHAVLWTKPSFSGDIKIEYEYTKLDDSIRAVTILYILATGSDQELYMKDITKWNSKRTVPSMRTYFNNMNTYHISYAAYATDNTDSTKDYIRARRYMPIEKKGLKETGLKPDYLKTGLFKTGISYKITIIKKGMDLFMYIWSKEKNMLCHWNADSFPPILEGRIGLRHMYTRSARYRNFRVSIPNNSFIKDE